MIRFIDHKKIELTDLENSYYEELVDTFSRDDFDAKTYFCDLFETNNVGIVQIIKPSKPIPQSIVFFIQNVMINQRLNVADGRITEIERRLEEDYE